MKPAIHRRWFIQSSVAFLASGTLTAHFPWPASAWQDDRTPWTLGFQSYTFREFKLEKALEFAEALGLKYAEFYQGHIPLKSTAEQIKVYRQQCLDHGVTPVAYGVQSFGPRHDENKRVFDFAKQLGVTSLTADPTADSFDSLDKLVEEFDIAIAIHPHGPVGGGRLHRWYSAEVIMQAIKDHHPKIGTCLDTGHLIRCAQAGEPLDPAQQVRKMGARNFGLHLKDHDNQRRTDVILGQGALNLIELHQALLDVQFKGFISLEYEANPKDPRNDLAACIEAWNKTVKS